MLFKTTFRKDGANLDEAISSFGSTFSKGGLVT